MSDPPPETPEVMIRNLFIAVGGQHYWHTLDLLVSPYERMRPTYVCWRGMVRAGYEHALGSEGIEEGA
jgi:hypothetical protein